MTYYGFPEILEKAAADKGVTTDDLKGQHVRVTVELAEGDTAVITGSTKKEWVGPGKVTYVFWPDGGVGEDVIEGATYRRKPGY
ncbi:hypothetical protein [Nonomuraea sp. SYSU D8015]|uniref:hypothetical protein n=1 Tax=Nonomuraea sp. SYSU D8015 TaxID=2593644 RepID=UPI0016615AF4|nr:hypothetical protein [Nonomuraea sp. SYSU D8015]